MKVQRKQTIILDFAKWKQTTFHQLSDDEIVSLALFSLFKRVATPVVFILLFYSGSPNGVRAHSYDRCYG